MCRRLWVPEDEENFFSLSLKKVSHDKLFYSTNDGRYVAYWPKGYKGRKTTLQSRNSLIGEYTEKWLGDLLAPIAKQFNAVVINGATCSEIGIDKASPADIAIVNDTAKHGKKPGQELKADDILLLIEVKMSVVWNWEYNPETQQLKRLGDYTTHSGMPSLLRSDTMLKAIGKAVNIRIHSLKSASIPIIVVGNTPISKSYYSKVDLLKKSGIIQGFYSVNPNPLDRQLSIDIKHTNMRGFVRMDSVEEFYIEIEKVLRQRPVFFAAMLERERLGQIVEIADLEQTYEKKAIKFLKMITEIGYEEETKRNQNE